MEATFETRDFNTLRNAYREVKSFVEREAGDKVSSLKDKIVDDLGCAGDDNNELLEKFVKRYNLDTAGFNYSRHFLSEGELFSSTAVLMQILVLPMHFINVVFFLFSFGNIRIPYQKLVPDWNRQITDMAFGDLLTWYLTGKYSLREKVRFYLPKATLLTPTGCKKRTVK